jgi:replication-associated recombination protein RarA
VEGLRPAAPTLLGRHVELARAELALRRAAAGEITMLVVRGPGGIGKTALCTALTAVARDQGWIVVPVQALGTQVRTRRSWTGGARRGAAGLARGGRLPTYAQRARRADPAAAPGALLSKVR